MKDWIKNPFVVTILLAVVISVAVLYGVLKWLDVYTHHNQAVVVPDVKGLTLDDAAPFFKNSHLRYNVIDSVFSKDVPPGSIVELIPPVGTKVKEGRILFVTINAITSQMALIPEVEDLSFRQAFALLKSRGFTSIEIEYVEGKYKDLAVCVESNGRTLRKGEQVLLTAPLILKVSSGESVSDTLFIDDVSVTVSSEGGEESWF